ncbi:MAG: DNA polymerase I, partial [Lachnospiraceae bacterium]|nr:DNA polymerase I [Lachnospiraceae bacterium]
SKKLATIDTSVDIDLDPASTEIHDIYNEASYEIFKRLELRNILKRFDTNVSSRESIRPVVLSGIKEFTDSLTKSLVRDEAAGLSCIRAGFSNVWTASREDGSVVYFEDPMHLYNEEIAKAAEKVRHAGGVISVIDLKAILAATEDKVFDIDRAEGIFDCSLNAYLINPLADSYEYDILSGSYLHETLPSRHELLGKLSDSDALGDEKFILYAGYLAYTAQKLYKPLAARIKEEEMEELYKEIELPLVFVLNDMEKLGIQADSKRLTEYSAELKKRIDELAGLIYERAGEEFNINSPKQLGTVLFDKMRLPVIKKTSTGYSTSVEVLEKLKLEDPIINYILEYRQLAKLKSTYTDGLVGYISEDGRIHSTFNQKVTATGRISSTDPNLQNIPVRIELGRLIRKAFTAKKGATFLDADYSQIELRVLAHMSGDPHLIEAYRENRDIHAATASKVFGVPLEEVTPLMRRNAKAVNFGIIYGISAFGLSEDLGISQKEAKKYMNDYFETYPHVKEFMDKCVSDAKERGYSLTLYNRKRPIPELTSGNFMQRSFGERVAMNAPIQGTAADIIKIAMIKVYKRLRKEGLKSRLILQVHDELLIETVIDEIEAVSHILQEEMEHAAELKVPLIAEVSRGDDWYSAK